MPLASAQAGIPVITNQPLGQTVNPGVTVTLSVAATGATAYQWYENSAAVGSNSPTLTVSSEQAVTYSVYVVASNSAGYATSDTVTVTFAVVAPPTITSSLAATAALNQNFLYAISASGLPTSYAASGLPAGLVIDAATGAITGVPTTAGTFSVVLSATNALGTGTSTLALAVAEAPSLYAYTVLSQLDPYPDPFEGPTTVAVESPNSVYIADTASDTIRDQTGKILAGEYNLVGGNDGAALTAHFYKPSGIAVDLSGNLYIADTGNDTIRELSAGVVTTLAGSAEQAGSSDGAGSAARFNSPRGVAVDASGNVYVADTGNSTIRMITPSGAVTTLAGGAGQTGSADGVGPAARFNNPVALAVDAKGNVYVADSGNGSVREIAPNGTTSTIASGFSSPTGIVVDGSGNVFVADTGNKLLEEIFADGTTAPITGLTPKVEIFANPGSGISFTSDQPQVISPTGLTIDGQGALYWLNPSPYSPTPFLLAAYPYSPVSIETAPVDATLFAGTDEIFSVKGAGSPLSYYWYREGAVGEPAYQSSTSTDDIPATLYFDGGGNFKGSSAGTYTVAVYNAGSYATATFTLSIAIASPDIAPLPAAQSVAAGQSVTLTASASAPYSSIYSPPLSYSWSLNGAPIPGASGSSYTISNAQDSDAGSYTVTVGVSFDGFGSSLSSSATSNAEVLTVTPAVGPLITAQPTSVSVASGASVTLQVSVAPDSNLTYQWNLNGNPISGATASAYTIGNASSQDGGSYTVAITDAAGTVVSSPATLTVSGIQPSGGPPPASATTRLIDLSARAYVSDGDNALIAGFVTSGSEPKLLLVRGIGPTLAAFGVSDPLDSPVLTLFSANNATLGSNSAWGGTIALQAAFLQVGAFALPGTSDDTALLMPLPSGSYTAVVGGASGGTGVALAEIYDADSGAPASRLINLSARGYVGTGSNILIAGFVVGGTGQETVLIRAIGPGLTSFGVSGSLAVPQLTVIDANGSTVAQNTGWGGNASLRATFSQVGAFALDPNSSDAALVVSLPAGSYTAQVSGAAASTGVALVEIYEVP